RFGNVLASRGSVLHTFSAQIKAKAPVTVTDPEVRRYFMTVEEAIELVIQAGAVGTSGEALVLDMGEPVRIAGVAQRMIAEANESVEVVYTGLRTGEKLNESLFNSNEVDRRPNHPLVSQVEVPPIHPGRVAVLDPSLDPAVLVSRLRELCHSTGLRLDDKPSVLDLSEVELDPGVAERLPGRLLSIARNGRGRECAPREGCCELHRRWGDRDASRRCPSCPPKPQVELAVRIAPSLFPDRAVAD
ncbi:MAG: polysaccharide biosynthesis protein, partial [Acidimicrobiales bacterium]